MNNESRMPTDIDKLTEPELIDLNHRIVARLNFLGEMRAHEAMLQFRIGDRVAFQPTGRAPLAGMPLRGRGSRQGRHHAAKRDDLPGRGGGPLQENRVRASPCRTLVSGFCLCGMVRVEVRWGRWPSDPARGDRRPKTIRPQPRVSTGTGRRCVTHNQTVAHPKRAGLCALNVHPWFPSKLSHHMILHPTYSETRRSRE